MQPLTEHQRAIALEYLAQMDRAERISREAEEARNEAAQARDTHHKGAQMENMP